MEAPIRTAIVFSTLLWAVPAFAAEAKPAPSSTEQSLVASVAEAERTKATDARAAKAFEDLASLYATNSRYAEAPMRICSATTLPYRYVPMNRVFTRMSSSRPRCATTGSTSSSTRPAA